MMQCVCAVLLGVVSIVGPVFAQREDIDRSLEVEHFVHAIETSTRVTLTQSALEIADADLTDAKLASAIHAKLMGDLPQLSSSSSVDEKYQIAMITALAATGRDENINICKGMKGFNSSDHCKRELAKTDWYKTRNQLAMPQRPEFRDDEAYVARLANLLAADNDSFKLEAAERMDRRRILDSRLLEMIDAQVRTYTKSKPPHDYQTYLLGVSTQTLFVKLLGYSANTQYRETLNKVIQSNVNVRIKIQALEAERRLAI